MFEECSVCLLSFSIGLFAANDEPRRDHYHPLHVIRGNRIIALLFVDFVPSSIHTTIARVLLD